MAASSTVDIEAEHCTQRSLYPGVMHAPLDFQSDQSATFILENSHHTSQQGSETSFSGTGTMSGAAESISAMEAKGPLSEEQKVYISSGINPVVSEVQMRKRFSFLSLYAIFVAGTAGVSGLSMLSRKELLTRHSGKQPSLRYTRSFSLEAQRFWFGASSSLL